MKRGIKFVFFILISALLGGVFSSFRTFDKPYLVKSDFKEDLISRGLKGARAFSYGEDNIYLALENKILKLDKHNNISIEREEKEEIYDLEYYKGKIYYVIKGKLLSYDLRYKGVEVLLEGIENEGLNKEDTRLLIKDESIYLAIGTKTNSGIVDNIGGIHDVPPVDIILSGRNYDENRKGAFVPYNTKTKKGEEIKGNILGNGGLIKYSLENQEKTLFSYGLRNITGLDYNSKGEIFATVGGIEEKGYRPLANDSDYLYKIEGGGTWYGWPDYTGGEPLNSKRFRKDGSPIINFITEEHKSYKMPKPLYKSYEVNSLKSLVIDREGIFSKEKDSILFFDNRDKKILKFLKGGDIYDFIDFNSDLDIKDMKIIKGELYILDGYKGALFKVNNKVDVKIPIYNYYILIGINIFFIFILFLKLKSMFKENKNLK